MKINKIEGLINPLKVIGQRKRLTEIQQRLCLKFTPTVIDSFDNSHTSGTEAVCGMVRFTLLQADKSQWRKFIIKSGAGGDDYGSFDEVLTRRFKRLVEEKTNLPNLVIIDGARSQLNVAISVLKSLNIYDKLDVISISKDDRHKANSIHLTNGTDVSISGYNEFAHILNEVHRFSLDFHRKRMSKKMFK